VHELKELLVENFSCFQVQYAPRECNRAAHELAAIGCKYEEAKSSLLGLQYWPECLIVS
jgi:hypothetical protein